MRSDRRRVSLTLCVSARVAARRRTCKRLHACVCCLFAARLRLASQQCDENKMRRTEVAHPKNTNRNHTTTAASATTRDFTDTFHSRCRRTVRVGGSFPSVPSDRRTINWQFKCRCRRLRVCSPRVRIAILRRDRKIQIYGVFVIDKGGRPCTGSSVEQQQQ